MDRLPEAIRVGLLTGSAPESRPSRAATTSGSIEGIEGLRAIAAGSILVYHVWIASGPGENAVSLGPISDVLPNLTVGVTLFFTLSAFLLYHRFAGRILRGEPNASLKDYARNRVLRILPAYWLALVLCGFVLQTIRIPTDVGPVNGGFRQEWALFPLSALFLQNFTPRNMLGGIGPAWSLNVEAVFYLALPVLVLAASWRARGAHTRAQRRLAALMPAVILFVIGLSGKAVAYSMVSSHKFASGWGNDWQSVVERGFWGQADLFAFGIVVAVVSVEVSDGVITLPSRWRSGAYAGAALLMVLTAWWLPNENTQRGELGHFVYGPLTAIACALLLAAIVISRNGRGHDKSVRWLKWRPLVGLGVVSYGLFLWHLPLIYWLRAHDLTFSGRSGFAVNVLLTLAVTTVIAAASYFLVERPALAHRRRTASETAAAAQ
jgi:peptidoglycan/LPS O-acetylase OafA/YrhL